MNYTEQTKLNILDNLEDNQSSDFAFMWGVTKCNAGLQVYSQGYELVYEIKNERLASTVLLMLKKYYKMDLDFNFTSNEPRLYTIKARGNDINIMLKAMGLSYFDTQSLVYQSGVQGLKKLSNRMAVQSFMQGVFCSSGGVYMPSDIDSREGYHLEINFFQQDFTTGVQEVLSTCGIELNMLERGNSYVLYSKNSQTISDFLAFVMAMDCVTLINDIMIKRQVNNQINRASNSLVFNADKIATANIKYMGAISKLKEHNQLGTLDSKLKNIATARLEDVSESMGELAQRLEISKSSLNRALNKLVKLSEEI